MLLGYNTNGFSNHHLGDAIAIISELGYQSVAITLEREQLDPPDRTPADERFHASSAAWDYATAARRATAKIKPLLELFDLRVTIETGSRFLLDPRRKHQPTLLSRSPEDRQRRIQFLNAAIDIAADVKADCVSLWSGAADDQAGEAECWTRLNESVQQVVEYAASRNVRLAFEPEPGMFIDTMNKFAELVSGIDHPLLGLTLDVGHVHCLGDGDVRTHVTRWRDRLWNVHIEDMKRGVHEHLMFGEGDMDFDAVFAALSEVSYTGPVHVELSRHSHDAVESARKAIAFLRGYSRENKQTEPRP